MKPKICVLGSANVDFVMQVPRLPGKGETVGGGHFFQAFGGKGANQAVAAARSGGDTTWVGAVGNDPNAQRMLDSFSSDGLHLEHIKECENVSTGSALIMVDASGNNYISVAPGANAEVTPEFVSSCERAIEGSDWIVLQMETPTEANERILDLAATHHVPVLFNYAPAVDLTLRRDERIHGLVVNETEAAALLGREDATDMIGAARELLTSGRHRFVVLTLGVEGALVATAGDVIQVPAYSVRAIDATAAGDTFCGALAVALGEGKDLAAAVRFATAAAALAVTRAGAQPSIPKRDEILQLMKSGSIGGR